MLPALLAAAVVFLAPVPPQPDWLVDGSSYKARVHEAGAQIVLENGLVRRTFTLQPGVATVALDNLMTGQSELRSVRPEARVTLNGTDYPVGGLTGQPIHNYLLPQWLDTMTPEPNSLTCFAHEPGTPEARFAWARRGAWAAGPSPAWPPPGVRLTFRYSRAAAPPDGPRDVIVEVHYELYDGVPVMSKWISIVNDSPDPITLDAFTAETLACVEPASMVGGKAADYSVYPRSLHVETDFSFGGSMDSGVDAPAVKWKVDPLYQTQVNYERQTPCLLECAPPLGPGVTLAPGERFESFRVFELFHDSTERDRRGLSVRRMYRTIAPWVLENPLIFHVRSADPASVRAAIDQAADVGFELVIMTFGSGFDIENTDPMYLASLKDLADYAHTKSIALGGYSLLASRSIDAANDVINPATGKPGGFATFGNSPCLGSAWGQTYFRKLYNFYEATGMDVLEHDGSYPGDACASTTHPGHRGHADSQWTQWRTITDFYRWCRGRGVYLNVPDWYYLAGSSKCGMGYRETNWSLPREQQEIIERQNIYDGTWTKTPSMGWMFVPLTEYHGGGPAATIEPLHEHLDHYETRLRNLLSAGVQACWRGPRLYDTDETRALVKRWVGWYKEHRAILESDILHGRRPDGRDIDWFVHVNPELPEKAMLIVHNPLNHGVERTLELDLSLAGLTTSCRASANGAAPATITPSKGGRFGISVSIPARGMAWVTFEAP
jgi:hypothetical protein